MITLLVLVSFVVIIALIVGLVRPSIVKCPNRKKVGMYYGGGLVVLFILIGVISPTPSKLSSAVSAPVTSTATQTATQPAVTTPVAVVDNTASKTQAQKDLDAFMATAEKANVVHSYEFSDTARVVYIDSVWYTQDVQFKKDFLAKVDAILIKLEGSKNHWEWFQVKDAYTNEKVGEVTAFSGSLEVYK